jgi:hypothetical protein
MIACEISRLGYAVRMIGWHRTGDPPISNPNMLSVGNRAIELEHAGIEKYFWLATGVLTRRALTSVKFAGADYIAAITREFREFRPDTVLCDHVAIWTMLGTMSLSVPVIGLSHHLEHEFFAHRAERAETIFERALFRREAMLIRDVELSLLRSANIVWALTEADTSGLAALVPGTDVREVTVHSRWIDQIDGGDCPTTTLAPFDIGLLGSWNWPVNGAGLGWFMDAVLPLLPAMLRVVVAGRGGDWVAHRAPNVEYLGFVDDARAFFKAARVFVIPTTVGGGLQIKTIEAISLADAIVTTTLGLRGIANPPASVHVADQAVSFAAAIVRAHRAQAVAPTRLAAWEWSLARRAHFRQTIAASLTDCAGV